MRSTSVARRNRVAVARDDRLLATTRWVSAAVVPVLAASFAILYLFPDHTMRLWSWMVCPHMSAFVLGGGYLSGAYFFTRASTAREWHGMSVGFVATTVFSTVLLLVTALHWPTFNHDHVSFWAWLLLYVTTPVLLPVLYVKNRRTDPGLPREGDVRMPRAVRLACGLGGAIQLSFAAVVFAWPDVVASSWPWPVDVATLRAISAFIAFPAVTWLWFLFEERWSSFRVTQQTATLGLLLLTLGALRARGEFHTDGRFALYLAALAVALVLNVTLYVAMERKVRKGTSSGTPLAPSETAELAQLVG